MQPITINQTGIQTQNLDESEEIRRGVYVLALLVASAYVGVRTAYFTFKTLRLSTHFPARIGNLPFQPIVITSQLSDLNDDKLTKYCQSIELLNYGKLLHANMAATSCGKTAHAVTQFVSENFYQTDVIVDQYILWDDFVESLKLPDERVYRIGLFSCNFFNDEWRCVRFPGHEISIIQYPSQINSSKRYQVFQSYINIYSLKDYISKVGNQLLSFEELQGKYLSDCYKIVSQQGAWTKEITSSFSKLSHTEESVGLQFLGFTPEYGSLSYCLVRSVPKPRIYKYLSKNIIYGIPASILGFSAGIATFSLGILFGRYIFSTNND